MDTKALYKITYGLFLLTSKDERGDNGSIINTAMQIANDPTRICIAVINRNYSCEIIKRSGVFNISCLSTTTPFEVFKRFGMQSGRDVNKFEGFEQVSRSENGLLYLTAHSNAYLSAQVVDSKNLGSHTMFFATLTDGAVLGSEPSWSYAFYQSDIKPKPAGIAAKKQWVCSVCGYVHEGGELPENFVCPLCHHGREVFSLVEAAPAAAEPAVAKKWVCPVCGYIHEGQTPPEQCPVCHVAGAQFKPKLD